MSIVQSCDLNKDTQAVFLFSLPITIIHASFAYFYLFILIFFLLPISLYSVPFIKHFLQMKG